MTYEQKWWFLVGCAGILLALVGGLIVYWFGRAKDASDRRDE
jgi:hypothetical protein